MQIRFLRLIPIFLSIVILTWFLPENYLRATKGDRRTPSGQYSAIINDFIIWDYRPSGLIFRNMDGQEYSPIQARRLMPFVFYNDVLKHNGFPLTINGHSFSYADAAKRHRFRISPNTIFSHHRPLHFLMESSPETAGFSLPDDLMVLTQDKVRFIDCRTGNEDKEKGMKFTQSMVNAGVVFPIILSATNPNTHKKIDEGMLFIDSQWRLFHLKQVKHLPVCEDLNHKFETLPLFINVDENLKKDYYGQVVTENRVYLVTYEKQLIPLPVPDYNARRSILKVWNKPVYQTLILKNTDIKRPTEFVVVDESWQVETQHSEPCPPAILKHKKWVNCGLSILSPFRLKRYLPDKPGPVIDIVPAPILPLAVVSCAFFAGVYLFLTRRQAPTLSFFNRIRQHAIETLLVLFLGFPGLIAILIFGPLGSKRIRTFVSIAFI